MLFFVVRVMKTSHKGQKAFVVSTLLDESVVQIAQCIQGSLTYVVTKQNKRTKFVKIMTIKFIKYRKDDNNDIYNIFWDTLSHNSQKYTKNSK